MEDLKKQQAQLEGMFVDSFGAVCSLGLCFGLGLRIQS
jgi:hypothetical protein